MAEASNIELTQSGKRKNIMDSLPSGSSKENENKSGIFYALAAFITWGVLPVYWKWLGQVPAMEILAHRILWSFVFVFILFSLSGGLHHMKELLSGLRRPSVWLSSILISCNWLIYIWSVNSNHVVDASLGYYINPLLSIALGTLFLKETLSRAQWTAIGLAAAGVVTITLYHGQVPWIGLSLAATFAAYGWTKKHSALDAKSGLALETLVVLPLAIVYLLWLHGSGGGSFSQVSWTSSLLLMGAGAVTALPLLWFAQASKRTSFVTLGFIQYLGPTISLIIGVVAYHETFTWIHWLSFGLIWVGLALYTISRAMNWGRAATPNMTSQPAKPA
jgi:chloramphenicol-sensitive protein RarD